MTVGFYTVLRRDPQHFLHAGALVGSVHASMPGCPIVQFTDIDTPEVEGVTRVQRLPDGPMLERRLEHYASCSGEWLLLDTDTCVAKDVRDEFTQTFDIAIADRNWKGIPQGDETMHTMPFNTGVVFSRSQPFWRDVLTTWRTYPKEQRDWMSEQRAVYAVIRTGQYRIRILPGEIFNYPPRKADDSCVTAAIVHFKGGQRKQWFTDRIVQSWRVTPNVTPLVGQA